MKNDLEKDTKFLTVLTSSLLHTALINLEIPTGVKLVMVVVAQWKGPAHLNVIIFFVIRSQYIF